MSVKGWKAFCEKRVKKGKGSPTLLVGQTPVFLSTEDMKVYEYEVDPIAPMSPRVTPIDTPAEDADFGVQMVKVISNQDDFDFSMRIRGYVVSKVMANMPLMPIKRYNGGYAYIA